ncbi:hypothetical protein D3C87_1348030 [compost metagenome]
MFCKSTSDSACASTSPTETEAHRSEAKCPTPPELLVCEENINQSLRVTTRANWLTGKASSANARSHDIVSVTNSSPTITSEGPGDVDVSALSLFKYPSASFPALRSVRGGALKDCTLGEDSPRSISSKSSLLAMNHRSASVMRPPQKVHPFP